MEAEEFTTGTRRLEPSVSCIGLAHRLHALSERKRGLLFVIVLAVIPLVFLANVLFTDQVLVADNLATNPPWGAYASIELLERHTNRSIDPLYRYYPRTVIASVASALVVVCSDFPTDRGATP